MNIWKVVLPLVSPYLLTSSLEPHEHRGHAGLAVHQPDLLPELGVLEHALLVQLNPLLQDACKYFAISANQDLLTFKALKAFFQRNPNLRG